MKSNAFFFKKILEQGRQIFAGNPVNAGWLLERGIEGGEPALLKIVADEERRNNLQSKRDADAAEEEYDRAAARLEEAKQKAFQEIHRARIIADTLQRTASIQRQVQDRIDGSAASIAHHRELLSNAIRQIYSDGGENQFNAAQMSASLAFLTNEPAFVENATLLVKKLSAEMAALEKELSEIK